MEPQGPNPPHVRIAVVWTPCDIHWDRKFSHCGVDAFSLIKTSEGWKISLLCAHLSVRKSLAPRARTGTRERAIIYACLFVWL
ncbi:MAG: hypothetical protein Q8N47_24670 [Bryobacterales bacterium]|nr:hypothetical protein [Bryobacterales bacterium]